jgi:hypothetical protein
MKPEIMLTHEFIGHMPDELQERTLYVSMAFATVMHKCCCGCGREVVTPLSPTDWNLSFDGKSISLVPSIGSWNLPCQSHYWITHNRVRWAPKWSQEQIALGRAHEASRKQKYFGGANTPTAHDRIASVGPDEGKPKGSLFVKLKKLWPF